MASTIYGLYGAIKALIDAPDNYLSPTFQTMHDDKEGAIGIYIYEGPDDVVDMDGDLVLGCCKVQIQFNAFKSAKGLEDALEYLEQTVGNIESSFIANGIELVSAIHLGPPAMCIGRNEYDIQVCKSTLDLKYYK